MDKEFTKAEEEFKFYQDMFNDLPIKLDSGSMVLDFKCGSGGTVYQLL